MNNLIYLGIADDHKVLRQGYVALLTSEKTLSLQFDVGDGKELLDILESKRIDILILDLEMPKMGGIQVLEILKKKYPKIKVIILSAFFHKDYIIQCFKLGVKAFLRKEYRIENILQAIYETYEKGIYVDSEVAIVLAEQIKTASISKKADLTKYQIDVLKLISSGYTNSAAAAELGLSVAAIKFHRKNIMTRTKSKSLKDLVAFAVENKFIK